MIAVKDYMEAIGYKITEGSEYGWQCFGPNAYRIESWSGDNSGYSIGIILDTKSQEVYQAEAHDYSNGRSYRLTNPDYLTKYSQEVKSRNITDLAYDGVNYTDLEVDSDWIEKATAIVAGKEYSTDVSIMIDLPDNEMLVLFTMAHEANMTFNDFIAKVLVEQIEKLGTMSKKELKKLKKAYVK